VNFIAENEKFLSVCILLSAKVARAMSEKNKAKHPQEEPLDRSKPAAGIVVTGF